MILVISIVLYLHVDAVIRRQALPNRSYPFNRPGISSSSACERYYALDHVLIPTTVTRECRWAEALVLVFVRGNQRQRHQREFNPPDRSFLDVRNGSGIFRRAEPSQLGTIRFSRDLIGFDCPKSRTMLLLSRRTE